MIRIPVAIKVGPDLFIGTHVVGTSLDDLLAEWTRFGLTPCSTLPLDWATNPVAGRSMFMAVAALSRSGASMTGLMWNGRQWAVKDFDVLLGGPERDEEISRSYAPDDSIAPDAAIPPDRAENAPERVPDVPREPVAWLMDTGDGASWVEIGPDQPEPCGDAIPRALVLRD